MARPRKTAAKERGAQSPTERRATPAGTGERSDQVKSLVRALTLLNRLASTDEGASLSEVAQQVGLSPSTAHRLLTTLEQERYVHFDPERRLWSVGMQAFMAGNAFLRTRSLTGAARPHMRALMEESAETVNLAVEDQYEAVYLGPGRIAADDARIRSPRGTRAVALLERRQSDALGDAGRRRREDSGT